MAFIELWAMEVAELRTDHRVAAEGVNGQYEGARPTVIRVAFQVADTTMRMHNYYRTDIPNVTRQEGTLKGCRLIPPS